MDYSPEGIDNFVYFGPEVKAMHLASLKAQGFGTVVPLLPDKYLEENIAKPAEKCGLKVVHLQGNDRLSRVRSLFREITSAKLREPHKKMLLFCLCGFHHSNVYGDYYRAVIGKSLFWNLPETKKSIIALRRMYVEELFSSAKRIGTKKALAQAAKEMLFMPSIKGVSAKVQIRFRKGKGMTLKARLRQRNRQKAQ